MNCNVSLIVREKKKGFQSEPGDMESDKRTVIARFGSSFAEVPGKASIDAIYTHWARIVHVGHVACAVTA